MRRFARLALVPALASLAACQPASPPSAVPAPTEAMARHTPAADYPVELACADIGGTVTMKVVIGPAGGVTDVQVTGSSGVPELDAAAQEGVRAWEFTPATRNGQPIAQTIQVPMTFNPTPESELCDTAQGDPNRL
ncbi:energy transducer TonB [Lysobacter sp. SG-8]|uniref:Energy transducer TonB n=1 Tax=Marilutibacter penaei TaxID=2759900 RepID=A0A7W3YDQ3_9GAMM|nr:energy transducer TonB [Lysobacter penaei]MBB1087618.1 energy transducer TonB [Lysobacter penaei]